MRWSEPACLAACAVLLGAQLFTPHFIGLADNGDFPKVAGRLSLGPKDGPGNFIYFVPIYVHSSRYLWRSNVVSSELPLAWLAARLARANREGALFDMRWLAAVHAVLFLAAVYVLARSLRDRPGWRGWLLIAAAIFIFTDVNYAAYFNSFYSDCAALLGLLLMVATAVHITVNGMRASNLILFTLAALLLIGSKSQHALWGFLPALFLLLQRHRRAVIAGLVLLAASAITIGISPWEYRAQPLFTLIFSKLLPESPYRAETLAELGLRPDDGAFAGLNAFTPASPGSDLNWMAGFVRRTSYGAVLRWYLRHPDRAFALLDEALTADAPQMRAVSLSNFRREDGRPPGARTNRFAVWSNLRSALLRKWPYHVLAWYGLVIVGSIRAARRTPLGWVVLGIAVMGMGEFCVASLADAVETYRHLFLFHACTDLTICFAIAAI